MIDELITLTIINLYIFGSTLEFTHKHIIIEVFPESIGAIGTTLTRMIDGHLGYPL
jgi:hypothetical protein